MIARFADLLASIDSWGAGHAAAAVVGPSGIIDAHGDLDRPTRWASLTKPVTALAVLRAVDDDHIDLDAPAGPPGSTVRHLLAHTSGLPFEGDEILAAPGTRRIYSNPGFDRLGDLLVERVGRPVEEAIATAVLGPLGMTRTTLIGRPSAGLHGPLRDLVALAVELLRPTLLRPAAAVAMVSPAFPGLPGVVPGIGRFDDCAWGLGVELHGTKAPHWMATRNSPRAFGHFGGAGTFLWVDPDLDLALACLTDREFGPWALRAWPALSEAVVERVTGAAGSSPDPR
ncbi:MAG TPA: serine hydrolase domain-containing protein [Candidatus Saccharimonadales bacterium]|nr:serine hydrolase domain-containing protein [Candidatus Saccharimonadales bacterium]